MRSSYLIKDAIDAGAKLRNLITFFVITHVVFLVFGGWTVAQEMPGVMALRVELFKEIQTLPYLKPLTGPLAGSLALKVLYTFAFNLVFGAILSTTLTGVVFFLPYLIAVWRGFVMGVLFYGLDTGTAGKIGIYGTFLLEFGAYSVSSATGTDLGLSLLWPSRKRTHSRRTALRVATQDAMALYIIVIILLFLGAIFEMAALHYFGPFVDPAEFEKISKISLGLAGRVVL